MTLAAEQRPLRLAEQQLMPSKVCVKASQPARICSQRDGCCSCDVMGSLSGILCVDLVSQVWCLDLVAGKPHADSGISRC